MSSSDPLLQPYTLKHLVLRNRLMSTAHEPAYTHEGMPKDRYRLYHSEKAKGGIGLTMIGGSSVVAPDSPQAFGNIQLFKDEVVGWLRELADGAHKALGDIEIASNAAKLWRALADKLAAHGPVLQEKPAMSSTQPAPPRLRVRARACLCARSYVRAR